MIETDLKDLKEDSRVLINLDKLIEAKNHIICDKMGYYTSIMWKYCKFLKINVGGLRGFFLDDICVEFGDFYILFKSNKRYEIKYKDKLVFEADDDKVKLAEDTEEWIVDLKNFYDKFYNQIIESKNKIKTKLDQVYV